MWIVAFSICGCVTLVMSLAFCLCWKKKTSKNDWIEGVDGKVKPTNPDENVNHLPFPSACVVDGVNGAGDASSKRSIPGNTNRSLPEIPPLQENVNWEQPGDSSSEHYATVGHYQRAKRHTVANGVQARPSASPRSSPNRAFSTYERVDDHPYAQLQPASSRPSTVDDQIPEEGPSIVRIDEPSVSEPAESARRSSLRNGQGLDIPAATAVAGGIAASPELPYMTPPVAQTNFSGDSQDSSKGYTSISVREPLANIIAQTKDINKTRQLDPHYSTVSDDSDDVYTTIPDPNQVYTSESETYARIPGAVITVEAEVNPTPLRSDSDEVNDELYEPVPQPAPPSVDSLKHVAQTCSHSHSRQASTSSSVANVGSPKPEKRQANSPLPPPPSTDNVDPQADKSSVSRNIDELYAKVQKSKRKNSSEEEQDVVKEIENWPSRPCSSGSVNISKFVVVENKPREHDYETLRKSRKCTDPGYERIKNEEPGYASINGPDSISSSDPGYEVLKQAASEIDPNYEQLKHKTSNASDLVGYARISEVARGEDGYSIVNKPKKSDEKSRTSSSFGSNTQSQDVSLEEPNYESMPNESLSDNNYATTFKSSDSETDPNYESVNLQSDPNYERVKYEPAYEKLDDDSSRADSEIPGYEKVGARGYENIDTSESSNGTTRHNEKETCEPPYRQLDAGDESDVPGYEKINKTAKTNNDSSTDSSSWEKEPNYSTIKDNSEIINLENSTDIHAENAIFQV